MAEDYVLVAQSGDRVLVAVIGIYDVAVYVGVDDVDKDSPPGFADAAVRLTGPEAEELANMLYAAAEAAQDATIAAKDTTIAEAVRRAPKGDRGR